MGNKITKKKVTYQKVISLFQKIGVNGAGYRSGSDWLKYLKDNRRIELKNGESLMAVLCVVGGKQSWKYFYFERALPIKSVKIKKESAISKADSYNADRVRALLKAANIMVEEASKYTGLVKSIKLRRVLSSEFENIRFRA